MITKNDVQVFRELFPIATGLVEVFNDAAKTLIDCSKDILQLTRESLDSLPVEIKTSNEQKQTESELVFRDGTIIIK